MHRVELDPPLLSILASSYYNARYKQWGWCGLVLLISANIQCRDNLCGTTVLCLIATQQFEESLLWISVDIDTINKPNLPCMQIFTTFKVR